MKKFKEWLKTSWQVPRKKAAIKLGLYMLMMLFICLFVFIGSSIGLDNIKEDNNVATTIKKEEPLLYQEMIRNLLNNNYEFNYEITNSQNKYIYRGVKYNNYEYGTKEDINDLIKYFVEDNITYKISMNNKTLIEDLYNEINKNYLNVNYIYDTTKALKTFKSVENDLTVNHYTINSENDNIYINIYYSNTSIEAIKINYQDTVYDLKYFRIGKITEEDLGGYIEKENN